MKKKIRVYLRALEIDDHIKLHQWRNDKDIGRNFGSIPLFTSTSNEKKWVEERIFDKESVSCSICLKETDEFIGCIFLIDMD
ncbi:MAG TPA: N-acetyltransferase, partial [Caldithrix sp.]|nr:N-acetyltransferase [Caldithrix sp.]